MAQGVKWKTDAERRAAKLARRKRWMRSHPGYEAKAAAKRRARDPERARQQSRAAGARWRARRPDPEIRYQEWKAAHNLHLYGLPPEEYARILAAQHGVCAVCKEPETRVIRGRVSALSVDHDHACCSGPRSCGRCIRGLLCSRCNRTIGLLGDRAELCHEAGDYLQRGPGKWNR